jgi:hypothetical protein
VQLRIEFDLPESWKTLEVLPSARIPPVRWTVGPHQWTDNEPATLDLGDA